MRNLLIMLLFWSASGALLAVEAVRTVDVYVLP